jgi:hypothetical protein
MSDIDNLRSPYSLPMSPMMRPKCQDQSASDQYETVRPSFPDESAGARVTRIAKETGERLTREDALSGALRVACDMLVAAGLATYPVKFDALLVQLGGRVSMEHIDHFYEIERRKNTIGLDVHTKPGKAGS